MRMTPTGIADGSATVDDFVLTFDVRPWKPDSTPFTFDCDLENKTRSTI